MQKNLNLLSAPACKVVRKAAFFKLSIVIGMIKATITLNNNQTISDVCLYVLKSLVGDLIIGTDFLKRFETVVFIVVVIDLLCI